MATMTATTLDDRFTVPLYTAAEAGRYLAVHDSTFRRWAKGYRQTNRSGRIVSGAPLVTDLPPEARGAPSVPFIGLAEGMFLAALRAAGMPLQQIRPALELVRSKIGIDHALASRRLYVAGADLLWEVSTDRSLDADARHGARDMIVLRNNQYVFRQVIGQYLGNITYADEYATKLRLPAYEVADVATDPEINFGRPHFTRTGTPLHVVSDLLRAGEQPADVADDFGLHTDEVTEIAQRGGLLAA